jgi:carboxypeptidase family protein/TonB-dependent receptor-like protein
MSRTLTGLSAGALFLLLTAATGWAQATAELSGRVTDESGGVLPGVTVTATQTETGFTRTAVTDAAGTYVMPNLPVGPYRLEVSLQGFRTYVQTGIVLQVAAAPVINAVLAVGSLEETVAVEAAAPLVDVRSAGISDVVENERILELPLQGRQVTDLIVLAGAAVQQTATIPSHHFAGGVRIAVAGGQTFGVAYLLDGAMHNDLQSSGGMPLPFPDALQEFRVATSGLSADNGVRSGASVNAVTKSGTNNVHGNLFEFLRDQRFNATNRFSPIGPDGKRKDDGLSRHQFGGTLGGPIVRDKLFFFGGYQGTYLDQAPNDNLAIVPTAAMLAGDFTAFASPACNVGRQVVLRPPFVNNRVDPALFSPAAVNLARRLPTTTDPCGEHRFPTGGTGAERNEGQIVTKVDYQRTADHSLFGRYMVTFHKQGVPVADNLLTRMHQLSVGLNNWATSAAVGDTRVFGANTVNAFRVGFNRTNVDRYNEPTVEPSDLGIRAFSYEPHRMNVDVVGGFVAGHPSAGYGITHTDAYQVSDDLTLVRGGHQLAFGATVSRWSTYIETCARCGGQWNFNGQVTGLGLADFLVGRVASLELGGAGGTDPKQWYLGMYAQDAWRATSRLTLNMGLRWEPFFGQQLQGRFGIPIWSWENFRNGVRSTQFVNAPPGFLYAGDPGFPPGRSGINRQWLNFSPRAGAAWDVTGDGHMSVRASYGLGYDFPVSDFYFLQSSAPPFGNRIRLDFPPGGFDDPYGHVGGDPHPIATNRNTIYPPGGAFGVMDPDINSPRVQSWNVTVERQFGTNWGVAVSYLGNYTDRLWDLVPLSPAAFMGLGPCTINGVAYPVCSTAANTNARRVISLENPRVGEQISNLEIFDDFGSSTYRGLRLSATRRSAVGVSVSGNYTWSYCFGNTMIENQNQFASGPTNPADLKFDRGNCRQNKTHITNLTLGYQTPQFASRTLRVIGSDWRLSGIFAASSGSWFTVVTGRDTALNGQAGSLTTGPGQRVNQLSDDVYGAKTLDSYLNRAAFAEPAPGAFGNHVRNSIAGPGMWNIDLAVSRLLTIAGSRTLELRLEAFNLTNHFNWGPPTTTATSGIANLLAGTFGRITSQATPPRIMQFGIKYAF